MIRLFALILSATFTFTAQAEVKKPGVVVSSLCSSLIQSSSPQKKEIPTHVCVAKIVGSLKNYVVLDKQVWQITDQAPQLGGQNLKLHLVGFVNDMNMFQPMLAMVYVTADGFIKNSGQATEFLFVQSRSRTFQAKNFNIMFHTM